MCDVCIGVHMCISYSRNIWRGINFADLVIANLKWKIKFLQKLSYIPYIMHRLTAKINAHQYFRLYSIQVNTLGGDM